MISNVLNLLPGRPGDRGAAGRPGQRRPEALLRRAGLPRRRSQPRPRPHTAAHPHGVLLRRKPLRYGELYSAVTGTGSFYGEMDSSLTRLSIANPF